MQIKQPSELKLTYVHFLLSEFESRKTRNNSYSLRAFARDIGVKAPKLSEILRGKCGLSEKSAQMIADNLKLSAKEKELFINLVNVRHARSQLVKNAAKEKLNQNNLYSSFSELSLESFKIISDWYHFAILELTEVSDFNSEVTWVAKRLDISTEMTENAIERLIDFGLLERNSDGLLVQTHKSLSTPSGVPSSEIKKHHRQILAKAEDSLIQDPIATRDFSAITFAIPESAFEEIQNEIKIFRRRISDKYLNHNNKERVYSLAIQLFPLDKKKEGNI